MTDQVQKDLELVLAAANELTQLSDIELESDQPIRAAIARLRSVKLVAVEEGKHAYFSRFKPGDEVVFCDDKPIDGIVLAVRFARNGVQYQFSMANGTASSWWPEAFFHATHEEAQAECDRRNAGHVDENGKVDG